MHTLILQDPFTIGLLALNLPSTFDQMGLEKLVEHASRIGRVERMSGAESNLVCIRLFFDRQPEKAPRKWDVEIFLDARANYLVRKAVYVGPIYRRYEVLEFKEPSPGIFFPARIESEFKTEKKPPKTYAATISEIEINRPIPSEVFTLRAPHGTIVTDVDTRVEYRIDADGRRISDQTALPIVYPPPTMPDGVAQSGGVETSDEPPSATRWLWLASLCFLLAGVSGALYRRTRRSD